MHAGKVRYIGSSTFPAHQIVEAQWVAERRGRERFVCEQPPYSMLIRRIEADVLPVCEEYGDRRDPLEPARRRLAVRALPQGRRVARREPPRADAARALRHVAARQPGASSRPPQALGELAEEAGMSLIEMALAFVTTHPAVTAAIIGPRTMEQLESQLPALERTLSPPSVLDRIDEIVPPGHERQPERHRLGSAAGSTDAAAAPPLARRRDRCASSPASSPPGASTSATTSARSRSTSPARSAARGSSASSTCTRSPSPTTRPSCASASTTRPRSCSPPGLDPERCILFRQSDVREHTELTWLLSQRHRARPPAAHAPVPRQVAARSASWSRPALLLYPVLMAADVLAYRADEVPVGEDQREHLELMRDVARRFNARFGDGEEVLVVPEHRIPEVGARIMDLQDPTRKMSTTGGSEQGTVYVLDEPKAIEKKFKSAVTDSGSEVRRDRREARHQQPDRNPRGRPRRRAARRSKPSSPTARYGEFKGAVAAAVIEYLAPVRERYERAARRRDRARGDPRRRRRARARDRRRDARRRARAMGVGAPASGR